MMRIHQPQLSENIKLDIDISNDYIYDKEQKKLQVIQNIKISEKGNVEHLIIDITGIAIFQITDDVLVEESDMNIEYFAEHNAPAIIYPYVREYISSISSKAGINTIILPITNFHALADMKKKSQNKTEH